MSAVRLEAVGAVPGTESGGSSRIALGGDWVETDAVGADGSERRVARGAQAAMEDSKQH